MFAELTLRKPIQFGLLGDGHVGSQSYALSSDLDIGVAASQDATQARKRAAFRT